METVHLNVYGRTIAERRAACSTSWQNEAIDYSLYDQPAYMRSSNQDVEGATGNRQGQMWGREY